MGLGKSRRPAARHGVPESASSDDGEAARRRPRRIVLETVSRLGGPVVASLIVGVVAALFSAGCGADEPSAGDADLAAAEQSSLDESLIGKTPCGGTPETILILCYSGEGSGLSVYLSRGGRVRPLVDSDEPGYYIGVDLSPDQRRLALTRSHGAEPTGYWVEIMDLETRNLRTIAGTNTCWPYGWPEWSSDGEQFSVTAMRPDGREAKIAIAAESGEVLERDPTRAWPDC